ncbi:AI-2E family transporter [bacterium]|nr:AI-2E family transporter [bacterium]
MERKHQFVVGTAVFVFLSAFLWTTHTTLSPLLAGGILLFLLMGLKEYPFARRLGFGVFLILLVWFLIKAQGAIFPFLFAFVLAYLFDPLADLLEKVRIPRTIGVLLLLFLTLGILILIGGILIPSLTREISDLIVKVPDGANYLYGEIKENLPKILGRLPVNQETLQQKLLEEIPSRAEQVLSNVLKGVVGIGSFLGQIFNIVLIPILTFYFLKDFNKIHDLIFEFIPKKYRNVSRFYLWRTNRILGGYLRGQIIVCFIVGTLTGVGLALLGVPFSILLGVLAGILNIIPYIGLYLSLGIALITAFLSDHIFITMLKIGVVFFIVQMIEAYIISPKIVGERVGLHPLAVIFSILVFSRFLGFWGLVVGVPTAALIKFLIDEWKRRQQWREMVAEKTITEGS